MGSSILKKPFSKEEKVAFLLLLNSVLSLLISYIATMHTNSLSIQSEFLSYFLDISYYAAICFLIFKIKRANEHTYNYGTGKIEAAIFFITGMLMLLYVIYVAFIVHKQFFEMDPFIFSADVCYLYTIMILKNIFILFIINKILAGTKTLIIESGSIYAISCVIDNLIALAPFMMFLLFQTREAANIYVDIVAGLILVLSNLYFVFPMLKKSISQLLDRTLSESIQLKILSVLSKHYDKFNFLVDEKSRESGNNKYIELYIEFDGKASHEAIMQIIDVIKNDIEMNIPQSVVIIIPTRYHQK